jgi:hypothetical protein
LCNNWNIPLLTVVDMGFKYQTTASMLWVIALVFRN